MASYPSLRDYLRVSTAKGFESQATAVTPATHLLCLLSLERRVEGDSSTRDNCPQASLGADLVAWEEPADESTRDAT